jgi:hypothetical protein
MQRVADDFCNRPFMGEHDVRHSQEIVVK